MDRDHLEHLPGRTYFAVVAAVAGVALVVGLPQLISSRQGFDTVLWGLVVGAAVLSLLALAVAWEERRAHVHALVRQAQESTIGAGRNAILHELTRLGAHREVELLRGSPSAEGQN